MRLSSLSKNTKIVLVSVIGFLLLFFPEECLGAMVSVFDIGLQVGVWYIEFRIAKSIIGFFFRGFGFSSNKNNRVITND